jgi:hypothetical protein
VREEHRWRMSENKLLRRISGSNREEENGRWRKLYNEKDHNLYSVLNIISMIKSEDKKSRSCSMRGNIRITYKMLL